VADFVDIDPRNLVSVIDSLEERALVKRMPHPENRRSYHLALTKGGAVLARKLRAESVKLEEDMFDCLTPSEKTALHKLLLKLHRAIETNG
jgi:DNA-binding MarR family transcriptional regulator